MTTFRPTRMSRENHTGTRKRESGASGAKSLEDRHDRVRKDNKNRRRRTALSEFRGAAVEFRDALVERLVQDGVDEKVG